VNSDRDITITEVGPRDGLQNESTLVSVADKVALIDRLSWSGLPEIEVSAFVRPDVVPQLADAAEVFAQIRRNDDVIYSALVPNLRGLERAMAVGVDAISLFTAASETFAARNTNATIGETIDRFRPVVEAAVAEGITVRAYISCAVACPFEGAVAASAVKELAQRLCALGPMQIDLGDTIGVAVPDDIERLLAAVSPVVPMDDIVLHLHDTSGGAAACARRGIECGVTRFDGACGGLGGCPFAPGAPGNISTEALLSLCADLNLTSGVDRTAVAEAGAWMQSLVGRAE
jgi:isopropylmalate/homocitrate/citramalate synthase